MSKLLNTIFRRTPKAETNPARTNTITKLDRPQVRATSTGRPEQAELGGLMTNARTSSTRNASQRPRPSTSTSLMMHGPSSHQLGDFREIRRPATAPEQAPEAPVPSTSQSRPKKLPSAPVKPETIAPRSEWAGEPMSVAEMNALPRFKNLMGRPLGPHHVGRFEFESLLPGQVGGLGVSHASDFSEPSVDTRRPMTAPERQASTSASAMPLKPALKTSTSAPPEKTKTSLLSRWAEKKTPFGFFSKAEKPTPASTSQAKGKVRLQPTPVPSESVSSQRSEAFSPPSFTPRQFADDDSLRGMADVREQKFLRETTHSPAPSDDGIPEIPDDHS